MADFGFTPNLTASGTINPFRFVELNTANPFTGQSANAASDNILGVTDGSVYQYDQTAHAIAGRQITLQPSNTVQVQLGSGGAAIANLLTSDANGRAVVGSSTQVCYYIALEAGAEDEIIRAFRIGTRVVP